MPYQFNFGVVAAHWPALAEAAWLTVALSAEAMLGGLAIGLAGAFLLTFGPRLARWLTTAFVELIRNTPLLAQLFLLFFALPQFGIRLSPHAAGVIGLSINCGAYAIEIIRAGILAVPRGQVEAALSLGLSRAQIFRLVILVPALQTVYPALASQFIIVLLSSSIVSSLSVVELTATAASLQLATFRAFEIYFAVTLVYLVLSVGFRALFGSVYRLLLERQGAALRLAGR